MLASSPWTPQGSNFEQLATLRCLPVSAQEKKQIVKSKHKDLKPIFWKFGRKEEDVQNIMKHTIDENISVFRSYRLKYLDALIKTYNKQKNEINSVLPNSSFFTHRSCKDCVKEFGKLKRFCDFFGGKVSKTIECKSLQIIFLH